MKHIKERHCSEETYPDTSKLHTELSLENSDILVMFVENFLAHSLPVEVEAPKLSTTRHVYKKTFPFSVGTAGQLTLRCVLDIHHYSNKIRLATCYPTGAPLELTKLYPFQKLFP